MIVVLFETRRRDDLPEQEYERASERMDELVRTVPGFISFAGYTVTRR